jgi:hypothetical protein
MSRQDRHDRILGALCVVACPAITGAVLAVIVLLCLPPADAGHTFAVASRVGAGGFVVNLLAIAAVAVTNDRAPRRARGFAASSSNDTPSVVSDPTAR